jgi:hypothetical protein
MHVASMLKDISIMITPSRHVSQGHHWHSMMELLLRPSDVWMEDSQERQESKGLKWQILDLIDEKKEN